MTAVNIIWYRGYVTSWSLRGSSAGMGKRFPLLQNTQPGCGAKPAYYSVGSDLLSRRRQVREVNLSPLSSA